MASTKPAGLDRRKVVAALLAERGDALVVTGLGSPTYDTFAAGDHDLNFYLWGGMGGAAMAGLGLALAQPKRRVLVITGDGEMLMGLGALATIACEAPKNLAIAVIDNGHYGETGMQRAHTARGVDLAGIAKASGFKSATTLQSMASLQRWLPTWNKKAGPVFADIKVSAAPAPMRLPLRDGTAIKYRFRTALLGTDAQK
ncbi:MAG: thiamine pyrophosphate-dependent enzyme [Burkholderiales bacterium]|jgi:thiamine pyrophosphate-dependent acetolactate synthase large subunit-like protein